MQSRRRLPALAAALIVTFACAGDAAADSASDAFVARINKVLATAKPGDSESSRSMCSNLADAAFDLGAMAPAASKGAWPKFNASQRAAFRAALERRIASDCRSRSRDIAGKTMAVVGERQGEGGDRFIAVRAKDGGGRQLIWRVHVGSSGLRAVDVTVDGKSLAITIEKDAKALLQKAGGDLQQFVKLMGG